MFRDYFQPISSEADTMVANFLFVANVAIADFLSKPSSWSSVGKLWEYLKISTCMLEDGLLIDSIAHDFSKIAKAPLNQNL